MSFYQKRNPDRCTVIDNKTYCCDVDSRPILENNRILCRLNPDLPLIPAVPINSVWINILVLISFIGMITINTLATLLPINGKTTGEISDAYPNLLAPAGITFSIWGIIYVFLGIYAVLQVFTVKTLDSSDNPAVNLVFILSCIINIAWIFAWHFEQILLSLILMIGLFMTLTFIYLTLHPENNGLYSSPKSTWVSIPFSIYYGWISVALAANITTYCVSIGWTGGSLGETYWTVIILLAIVFVSIAMTYIKGDIFFTGVIVWAIIGIIIKRTADLLNPQPIIVTVAYIGLGYLCFEILFSFYRQWKKVQTLCPI